MRHRATKIITINKSPVIDQNPILTEKWQLADISLAIDIDPCTSRHGFLSQSIEF